MPRPSRSSGCPISWGLLLALPDCFLCSPSPRSPPSPSFPLFTSRVTGSLSSPPPPTPALSLGGPSADISNNVALAPPCLQFPAPPHPGFPLPQLCPKRPRGPSDGAGLHPIIANLLDLTNQTRSAWASGTKKAGHPVVLGGWHETQSSVFHKPKKKVALGWGRVEKRGSGGDQVCLEEALVQWGTEATGGSGSSQCSRLT